MGFAFAVAGTIVDHSSLPVLASKALNRRSLVAPTKTSPPAVTVGPALPLPPTSCLPAGSASLVPSTDSHATIPVFALIAISFDHGGRAHGSCGPGFGLPLSSYPFIGAENVKNGPTPFTLARSYACFDPRASKL